jgi:hypothetical protein
MNLSDMYFKKKELEKKLNKLIDEKSELDYDLLSLDDELTLAEKDIQQFDRIADSIVGIQAHNYMNRLPFDERERMEKEEEEIINAFKNLNNNSKPQEIRKVVTDAIRFRNSPFNEARKISSGRTSAILGRFDSVQDMDDIDSETEDVRKKIDKINNDILSINSEITVIDKLIKEDINAANILSSMKRKRNNGGKKKSVKKRKGDKRGGMKTILKQDPLDLMEKGLKVSPKDRKTRRKNVTVENPYSLEEKGYPSGEFGKRLTPTIKFNPTLNNNYSIKPKRRVASKPPYGGYRKTRRKNRR